MCRNYFYLFIIFSLFSRQTACAFEIDSVAYQLNPKDLIIPAGLLTIGTVASLTEHYDILNFSRPEKNPASTPFDDVFQYAPMSSLFLFDALGKEKHHPVDQFFVMALSYGITIVPVKLIKDNYTVLRPNGEPGSFPSGHTAAAFVGAHVIYKEFKDSNTLIAFSGYGMAGVVAASRIIHNRHWVSDVFAAAGIAMLSTELAYLIYFPVRNLVTGKMSQLFGKEIAITPVIHSETLGFHLNIRF
ncbi:MAG: phosphatase PAP2 family protein [Candidatus Symbiothrix sp.]|jgi:hypothetical protein|nr:phosphatase PAP2 family protein [Candidatus Symbiothrix sp.]